MAEQAMVKCSDVTPAQLLTGFAQFLKIDVANGDAMLDTVRAYQTHVGQWVEWCKDTGINPVAATKEQVKV